ncbi:MAG: hypothetical protein LQ351_000823 [Letrouitia transgressa]|nr:MAG: hypothetical protein LQ351_000823 [Letrouitia transgressa]
MKPLYTLNSAFLIPLLTATQIAAQTYSTCNPLTGGSCPPDPALGKSVTVDFSNGESDSFTPQGNPTYDSNGASFTVAQPGDSPQLNSKWYIMFGHVEFQIKPAPGVGIVSSAVLQSDDLDEIDWEWLGGDNSQVQSNYFGKGQTTTWNRGAFHANPNNQADFHTYTIDWTADQIVWQIDGTPVRTLSPNDAAGQYPQTPMMIKVGSWSGGDPSNPPGVIAWAGGTTQYGAGPFTMQVKSIAVTDYSTGTSYSYSGSDGTWQSIKSEGGTINSKGNGNTVAAVDTPTSSSTSNSAPLPFSGTHKSDTSSIVRTGYPWTPTTLATSASSAPTSYPGLPSGYKVGSDGKIYQSAAASTAPPGSPTSLPSDSSPGSHLGPGLEVVTGWDQRGFPTTITQAVGATKRYDEQGFLITPTPSPLAARSDPTAENLRAADSQPTADTQVKKVSTNAAAPRFGSMTKLLLLMCGHAIAAAIMIS